MAYTVFETRFANEPEGFRINILKEEDAQRVATTDGSVLRTRGLYKRLLREADTISEKRSASKFRQLVIEAQGDDTKITRKVLPNYRPETIEDARTIRNVLIAYHEMNGMHYVR
jgi:hypothetical protein